MSPQRRPIDPSSWIAAAFAAGVFLLTAALFGKCADHALLQWDDQLHLLNNPFMQPDSPGRYLHFWQHSYAKMYIPVTYNVWAYLYANSELKNGAVPGALLHSANVVVHAINVTLVYLLLLILLRDGSIDRLKERSLNITPAVAAAIGAMVFAAHPLQVESVAWVSEFRGLLAGMFCLMSILAYVVAVDKPQVRRCRVIYSLGVLAFAIAALCKPSAAALPLVIVVVDLLIKNRRWRTVALWMLPWLVISIAELRLMSVLQPTPAQTSALWTRPFIAGDSAAFYLGRLLWPFCLAADYARTPTVAMTSTWVWIAWLAPVNLLAIAVFARSRMLLVATLLFLAALAPTLGLVPFEFQFISTVADRYAYLALLGLAWLVAVVAMRFRTRAVAPILCGIALLAWRSVDQQASWRDGRALWTHAIYVNPQAYVARGNLAQIRLDDRDVNGAIQLFDEMIALAPNRSSGYVGRAKIARDERDFVGAERWYRAAIAADPRDPDAASDLGSMLAQLGRYDDAERFIRQSIAISPDFANGWSNLGVLLLSRNRPTEAIVAFERALAIFPRHALATAGLQNARAALQPIPVDAESLTKLANDSMAKKDFVAAGRYLKQLADLAPDNLWVANMTAQCLAQTGKYDEAIAAFERLIQLHPELPELRSNLEATRTLKARAANLSHP